MKYKVYIINGKAAFDREIPEKAILIGTTNDFGAAMNTVVTINNIRLTKNKENDKERTR